MRTNNKRSLKSLVIGALLTTLLTCNLVAQTSDNNLFSLMFEYEMAKDKAAAKRGGEELPSWVLERESDDRYIGVSDPNMTSSKMASEQALLRAWMLSQLESGAHIETVSKNKSSAEGDLFSSETAIVAMSMRDISLKVGRSYVSKYGEFFVEFCEVPYTTQQTASQFNFSGSDEAVISLNERLAVDSSDNTLTEFNTMLEYLPYSNYTMLRTTDDESVENQCLYANTIKRKGDIPSSNGEPLSPYSLKRGYWHSLLSSMIYSASSAAMRELTTMTSSADLNTGYGETKESSEMDLRVSIYSIETNDNNAFVEWDVEF